jgi:uncharacterized protein YdcH (DUF465 family)
MLPNDLIKAENKLTVKETFKEVQNHFKDDFPILDPVKEMKIKDAHLESSISKYNSLKSDRDKIKAKFDDGSSNTVEQLLAEYEKKVKLEKSVRYLAGQIEQGQKMVLDDD